MNEQTTSGQTTSGQTNSAPAASEPATSGYHTGVGEDPGQGVVVTKRSAGRNMPMAVGVGLGLGVVILASLYIYRQVFVGVMVVFLAIAAWEVIRAFAAHGIQVPVPPVAIGGVVILISADIWGPAGLIASLALTALAVMVWRMPAGTHGYVRDTAAGVFVTAYVPFLAGFAVLLVSPKDGADRIVTFIIVTICSDIGGFFAGSFLGKHKLAPAISPKKTWEGLAGSALACMIGGGLVLPWLLHGEWWQGVIVGAAAVCTATFGDLIESMIKRDLGIKDMGTLLPGHGGVMDRLDSLLATVPVVWLLFQAFVPS